MPRQENKKKVEIRLERELVDGDSYEVLYIDKKEIVAFHLTNIEALNIEHSPNTIVELIQNYFKNA